MPVGRMLNQINDWDHYLQIHSENYFLLTAVNALPNHGIKKKGYRFRVSFRIRYDSEVSRITYLSCEKSKEVSRNFVVNFPERKIALSMSLR
jgi:hypothetical protein